jgi:hypothetical protein
MAGTDGYLWHVIIHENDASGCAGHGRATARSLLTHEALFACF